jgi:hypothetical protein
MAMVALPDGVGQQTTSCAVEWATASQTSSSPLPIVFGYALRGMDSTCNQWISSLAHAVHLVAVDGFESRPVYEF